MADRVACLLLSNAVFALESRAPLLHHACAWRVLFSPRKRGGEIFPISLVDVYGDGATRIR